MRHFCHTRALHCVEIPKHIIGFFQHSLASSCTLVYCPEAITLPSTLFRHLLGSGRGLQKNTILHQPSNVKHFALCIVEIRTCYLTISYVLEILTGKLRFGVGYYNELLYVSLYRSVA